MLRPLFALACLASAAAAQPQSEAPAAPEPIEAMVLGVYHFAGGSDLNNLELDDHLSPTRQAEIKAVLDRLEAFAPTKIMVELEPEHANAFNARYTAWRDGEAELTANERDQLGMRLAARLGHDRLYAIDHQTGMDFDAMMDAAQTAGQSGLLANFQAANAEIQAYIAALEDQTVLQRLRMMNDPANADLHAIYLTLAQMGTVDNPVGAREMTKWWGRNLVTFARAAQHSAPGDRVLVIYGGGHKYLLDQFFSESREFVLVDAMTVLD